MSELFLIEYFINRFSRFHIRWKKQIWSLYQTSRQVPWKTGVLSHLGIFILSFFSLLMSISEELCLFLVMYAFIILENTQSICSSHSIVCYPCETKQRSEHLVRSPTDLNDAQTMDLIGDRSWDCPSMVRQSRHNGEHIPLITLIHSNGIFWTQYINTLIVFKITLLWLYERNEKKYGY